MKYTEAISFLNQCINYERIGYENLTRDRHLEDFSDFLKALDNPQKDYPIIHIAGTKGKGSTAIMIAHALEACGFKTGLFTSPHLVEYTERIKVGLIDITPEDFGKTLSSIVKRYPSQKDFDNAGFRTVFEFLTAMALDYFRQCEVDAVILETGLGGRLDATNVVEPCLSIITPLGLDHTETLGETIDLITAEKAGIIKYKKTVVVAHQQDQWRSIVLDTINKIAGDKNATVILAEKNIQIVKRKGQNDIPGGQRIVCHGFNNGDIELDLKISGPHQLINVQTVLCTLRVLKDSGWELNTKKIITGLEKVRLPGRIEHISFSPPIILDAAHCPFSFKSLISSIDEIYPDKPIIFILGLARRKRRHEILNMISMIDRVKEVIIYKLPNPRSEEPEVIVDEALSLGLKASTYPGINTCVTEAIKRQSSIKGCVLVAAGSFYGLEPLRKEFNKEFSKPR